MQKLSSYIAGIEAPYTHQAVFARRKIGDSAENLVTTAPSGTSDVLKGLVSQLNEPFLLLYILHTPRGEGIPGRYTSPEISENDLLNFINRFEIYLQADARFDLWVYSSYDKATIVWDRHNHIYAYGPLASFEKTLNALGFVPGDPELSIPHIHHYRSECDEDAQAVLSAFEWRHSALRPEDEQ